MAKILPYKCGIATYGAAMVGGASQIAYGNLHKIRHAMALPWPRFNNIGLNTFALLANWTNICLNKSVQDFVFQMLKDSIFYQFNYFQSINQSITIV